MPLQFDKQKNCIGGKSAEAIHWKYNFKVLNKISETASYTMQTSDIFA